MVEKQRGWNQRFASQSSKSQRGMLVVVWVGDCGREHRISTVYKGREHEREKGENKSGEGDNNKKAAAGVLGI